MPPSNITGVNLLGQISQQAYQAQLHNAQAQHQVLIEQLARHARRENVTPIRKERTPEEIKQQLEARLAEIEAEADRARFKEATACRKCRWSNEIGSRCKQALVIGFDVDWVTSHDWSVHSATICGPEKALWEPKRTWWQRILDHIIRIIQEG